MPRPNQIDEQRRRLLPVICGTFSELGYRRTTTAELAQRCEVQENILYRIWSDKKAMYLAAISSIFDDRRVVWEQITSEQNDSRSAGEQLLAYEAKHQGEFGFYRILFDALGEADDPEIRESLVSMYRKFHDAVRRYVESSRSQTDSDSKLSSEFTTWGLIGLATVSNIITELELLRSRQREQLVLSVGECLLSGQA